MLGKKKKGKSNLGSLLLNPVQNRLIRRLAEPAGESPLFVMFISLAQPLRAEIKGVPKGFVYTA